jgi:hypothetical protein
MMFPNNVYHFHGQSQLPGFFRPHFYMTAYYSRGKPRSHIVMGIKIILILHKVTGVFYFPDIVIIGSYPGQKRISADILARSFSQIGNHNSVAVGTRRRSKKLF